MDVGRIEAQVQPRTHTDFEHNAARGKNRRTSIPLQRSIPHGEVEQAGKKPVRNCAQWALTSIKAAASGAIQTALIWSGAEGGPDHPAEDYGASGSPSHHDGCDTTLGYMNCKPTNFSG